MQGKQNPLSQNDMNSTKMCRRSTLGKTSSSEPQSCSFGGIGELFISERKIKSPRFLELKVSQTSAAAAVSLRHNLQPQDLVVPP
jgi:hypothetical protein